MNRETPPSITTRENAERHAVHPAIHFRDILDFVEFRSQQTEALLFSHSRSFQDDIMEAWDHREENKSYWMFCVKWMRGELLEAMEQGTASALSGILAAVRPEQVPALNGYELTTPELKQRIMARLLPIMLLETVVRVRNASAGRTGRCPV